jgi:hypothetical protein
MITRSATPPDTAPRVWIAMHEFATARERQGAPLRLFGLRLQTL